MAANVGFAFTAEKANKAKPATKILAIAFLNKIFSLTSLGNRNLRSERLPTLHRTKRHRRKCTYQAQSPYLYIQFKGFKMNNMRAASRISTQRECKVLPRLSPP